MESLLANNLNPVPGTYVLIISATRKINLRVGQAGQISVRPGYYMYAGSARGPGGLRARVLRHIKTTKRCHWHIDY